MDVFSPYEPLVFACILLSLPVFYVLGAFFTPLLSTPGRNIAARLAVGAVVCTFGVAVDKNNWPAVLQQMLEQHGISTPIFLNYVTAKVNRLHQPE